MVANYVNLLSILSPVTSRQFAIMLMRNAALSTDTLNSITYQMTSATTSKEGDGRVTTEISLDQAEVCQLKTDLPDLSGEQSNPIFSKLKGTLQRVKEAREKYSFTVEDAASAVSQAVVAHLKPVVVPSMMGALKDRTHNPERSHRIQHMKYSTSCKACGNRRHWWTDNAECKEKVLKERRMRKTAGGSASGEVGAMENRDTETMDWKSIFPRGASKAPR